MSIIERARPEIRKMAAYASARAIAGMAPVTLNANESPWPGPADTSGRLNRYPDPQPAALVERLAEHFGVAPEQTLVTRGSDEAIDLLVRAFCEAGKGSVVQCPPTFGMYGISARIQGARMINVPLLADQGFALDAPAIWEAARDESVRLVFLCRPNNPTGSLFDASLVTDLCEALTDHAMVVVDEAYMDFSSEPSLAQSLNNYPNLGVLRTLSKAHALAGARCGCLLAGSEVVSLLKKIIAPYPLPTATIDAALAALAPDSLAATAEQTALLNHGRDTLAAFLPTLPYVQAQWPSAANFILMKVTDGPALCAWLAERGVLVRNFHTTQGLENCLRISVGSPPENARLKSLLESYSS